MRRLVLLALLVSLLVPAAARPALPVIERNSFVDVSVYNKLCAFPIEIRFEGRTTLKLFFDQSTGALERLMFTAPDVLTITNPANGRFVTGHETISIHVDFVEGTELKVGIPLHVNVPGSPSVLDAGRLYFDATGTPTLTGVERFFTEFDTICAYLA